MRTIKFRAWDIDNKKMILWPFDSFEIYPDEIIEINGKTVGDDLGENGLDSLILMQFTGLKDKNGKEIYEDDIVKAERSKGVIIGKVEWWDNREYHFVQNDKSSGWLEDDFEVIGNIYENPELLK